MSFPGDGVEPCQGFIQGKFSSLFRATHQAHRARTPRPHGPFPPRPVYVAVCGEAVKRLLEMDLRVALSPHTLLSLAMAITQTGGVPVG
ncbi:hypothetical protein ACOMHN_039730 [Nucella lapillus]